MLQMTRRELTGALLLAALLAVGVLLRVLSAPGAPAPLVIEPPPEAAGEEERIPASIVIHVAGAVAQPGVYTLPEGARVHEAVAAAGGVLPEADPHALNLAEPLYDGRRIHVPLAGDGGGESVRESGAVNINTATAAQLETLPGIGPAKAAAIISYREKNGPFRSLDDLTEVAGIGAKTVEGLKDYITLY
jgi:competence protein ComEA